MKNLNQIDRGISSSLEKLPKRGFDLWSEWSHLGGGLGKMTTRLAKSRLDCTKSMRSYRLVIVKSALQ